MRANQAGLGSKQGVVECTALLACMLERNMRNQQLNRAQGINDVNVEQFREVDPHHTILLSFKLSTSLLFG